MQRRSFVTLLALALGACNASTMAQQPDCYAKHNIPQPPIRSQTLALVDRTTPNPTRAVRTMAKAFAGAAVPAGQRVVVLSFAGISGTERLQMLFDEFNPAKIEDAELIESLPIRPRQRSQRCVGDAQRAWPAKVQAELSAAFSGRPEPFQRSEIIQALIETLRNFADADISTRVMVYSDGLQFGSGVSFYGPDKHPRRIDADKELAKLPPAMLKPALPALGKVRVYWTGLLLEDPAAANGGYYDAQTLEQLRLFWSRLLKGWGVQEVQIERELMNPRFEQPATPPTSASAKGPGRDKQTQLHLASRLP